jgi:biopolymer transport protein ExbD
MGAQLGVGSGPMAEMNVTPLIDVVLVLLVVFMVITPMLQSGLPVDLPEATQTTTVNDVGQHIVVSIHPVLGWAVEQEPANENNLIDLINAEYQIGPSRTILIKADKSLEYQEVRKVMDILAAVRITSVLIAATEE